MDGGVMTTWHDPAFDDCKAIADGAEAAVMAYYQAQGYGVEDVRDDANDRRRDIDFYLVADGQRIGVDVKYDTHEPVNFFLEDVIEDAHAGTAVKVGCFWQSRAEFWVYVFQRSATAYILPLATVQQYVAERYAGLRRVPVTDYRDGSERKRFVGLLLPVRSTVAALGIQSFTLPDLQ